MSLGLTSFISKGCTLETITTFYAIMQLIVAFRNFANAPENAIYCSPPVCSKHIL